MRITDIYIKNYRAFYGEHHITLDKDGKNLMVYGENGSGKSSLFTALKDFLVSSTKKISIEENVFIPTAKKNTASIKIKVQENAKTTVSHEYEVKITDGIIISADKSLIENANKIKGLFDYRSLLETHLNHIDYVNIFKILNENILPHATNRFTNREIGVDWAALQKDLTLRKGWKVVERIKKEADDFSKGFKYLLEKIQEDTNKFLQYFDKGLEVTIVFDKCEYDEDDGVIYGEEAILKIKYAGKQIDKHHLFLNEARLSALAISLYLASIKVNPLTGALKVIVLDDLLIGLDMSNRLPLLSILKQHFIDIPENDAFQIIMTTYDKIWFELVGNYFGTKDWKYIEIYSKRLNDSDFEIPVIKDSQGYLNKARFYLGEKDNKACAVYIRSEFEKIVKTICEKKHLQVTYKSRQKEFTTEDFWDAITKQTNLDATLVKDVEIHRGTVMNPFSHHDIERPEFTKELEDTIDIIESLSKVDIKTLTKSTLTDLHNQNEAKTKTIEKLETDLKNVYLTGIMKFLLSK